VSRVRRDLIVAPRPRPSSAPSSWGPSPTCR
jgi:hypothetical protein